MDKSVETKNLTVKIKGKVILRGIDFSAKKGGVVSIVGESGSGKTMLSKALLGILPKDGTAGGEIKIDGGIGLIMQDPFSSLDPSLKVGKQIVLSLSRGKRNDFNVDESLREVGLTPDIKNKYPHELSGGMRQRVAIACVLADSPDILIADESTSSLDAITENEILNLLDKIKEKRKMTLIIITHNFKIIKNRAHYIYVFKNGKIIEEGEIKRIFAGAKNEYTKLLIETSNLTSDFIEDKAPAPPLFSVKRLYKNFGKQEVLSDVSFDARAGERIGIIGRSGSGKTTLVRILSGLEKNYKGEIVSHKNFSLAMIFQEPKTSLNPSFTNYKTIAESVKREAEIVKRKKLTKREIKDRVLKIIEKAELDEELLSRKARELSGGQCQRVSIARALAINPSLLILDEAVSALDIITEKKFLDTIKKLHEENNLTILFISHDLKIIKQNVSKIIVLEDGKIIEMGDTKKVYKNPQNEWVKKLVSTA
jgi:peptide/nickel transport system ATP-binding protein